MLNNLRRWIALACALVLLTGWTSATAPYTYHFPRDHFAHDTYRTEWWYFTGHLHDAAGRRFGFELTFFRLGLLPQPSHWKAGQSRWYAYQLYPAHFAITDEREGRFLYAETFARDALGAGDADQHALSVKAGTWTLRGDARLRPRMHLRAADGGNALELTAWSQKPPAIHGVDGVSRKGACGSCASHYYSFTRLFTRGTLRVDGTPFDVSGIAWMDHEYGSGELEPSQTGWDWFSMQFDNGTEAMLYRLRERGGATTPQSSGSAIARDGRVTHLERSDFRIISSGTWRSPHTQATYPSGWLVTLRGSPDPLEVRPVMQDQELAQAGSTSYWEGDVDIIDARTHAHVGVGYVELTGYADAVKL